MWSAAAPILADKKEKKIYEGPFPDKLDIAHAVEIVKNMIESCRILHHAECNFTQTIDNKLFTTVVKGFHYLLSVFGTCPICEKNGQEPKNGTK